MRPTSIPPLSLCAAVALTVIATSSPALSAPTGARPSAKAAPRASAGQPDKPTPPGSPAPTAPLEGPAAASAAPATAPSKAPQTPALGAPARPEEPREKSYNHINHPLTSIVVPIAFFLTIILLAGTIQYMGFRKEQGKQQTLRLMVEKGVQIPVELISPQKRRGSDLRRGLVLIGTGLGISLFLLLTEARSSGAFGLGLIPALIGAGYLLAHKLEPPRPDDSDRAGFTGGAGSNPRSSARDDQDNSEPGAGISPGLDADEMS